MLFRPKLSAVLSPPFRFSFSISISAVKKLIAVGVSISGLCLLSDGTRKIRDNTTIFVRQWRMPTKVFKGTTKMMHLGRKDLMHVYGSWSLNRKVRHRSTVPLRRGESLKEWSHRSFASKLDMCY